MLFGTSVYCPVRRDLRCLMRETLVCINKTAMRHKRGEKVESVTEVTVS